MRPAEPSPYAHRTRGWSADLLDDLDQLVGAVTLLAGEVDEVPRSLDDSATLRCARDRDAASAAELEQSLVAEEPERTQDGVRVDAEDGGEVFCGWEALAGLCLALGDRTANLGGDLLEEIGGIATVEFDIQHDASNTSVTDSGRQP